jgi:hypothetical protein
MPLIALKAHYDGYAVIFDEPFDLPPETPLLVVVNPQGTPSQPSEKSNRAAAFQAALGALRGKLSSTEEFMARKTNVGFDPSTGSVHHSAQPTDSVWLKGSAQAPKSKQPVP